MDNGRFMEIKRTGEGIIYFYVDEEYLKKYGVKFETFKKLKPFKADIFDDLLDKAIEEYGVKFNKNTVPKSIHVRGNTVIFEVKEKSNILYMENEFFENENIARGIWELFRMLPDEKISMGIVSADKKRKLLEQIRSDKGLDYIREYFID